MVRCKAQTKLCMLTVAMQHIQHKAHQSGLAAGDLCACCQQFCLIPVQADGVCACSTHCVHSSGHPACSKAYRTLPLTLVSSLPALLCFWATKGVPLSRHLPLHQASWCPHPDPGHHTGPGHGRCHHGFCVGCDHCGGLPHRVFAGELPTAGARVLQGVETQEDMTPVA
jgi:hypothetical protein